MTTRFSWKFLRGLAMTLAVAATFGCAQSATYKKARFDERYRVFFARELAAEDLEGQPPEAVIQKFQPETAIRQSVEDFAKQGYRVHEIKPIPWGEGATLITFRRDYSELRAPDQSAIHYIGTYRVKNDDPQPTYYVFTQRRDGYTIHVKGAGGPRTFEANWEGRELAWATDEGFHKARLTPDGRWLVHVIESAEGFDVPRTTTTIRAERLRPMQKPDPADVREGRSFLARLKPNTPDWYDPYPW